MRDWSSSQGGYVITGKGMLLRGSSHLYADHVHKEEGVWDDLDSGSGGVWRSVIWKQPRKDMLKVLKPMPN